MSDQNDSMQPEKNNGCLVIVSGREILIPLDLETEIGSDSAYLLMLLDQLIGEEGFERDGYRWIKKSDQSISDELSHTWTANKVKRELRKLADKKHLIVMIRFDAPQDPTPYIRFNIEALKQLKSIRIVEDIPPGTE